jgi:RNA polymerase sigma factor (sigma-70 family)
MSAAATHRAINAVWRIESAKIIAGLARVVHDVGLAEDLAQDALVAALEQWPEQGVPDNPAAWLMAVAKHRAIDRLRRSKLQERKYEEIIRELNSQSDSTTQDFVTALDDDIGDDLLRLIFTACHPALSAEARAALTLRLLGGLTTGEIARAFLVPEPTIAQRIVRAKRTLAETHIPFEVPRAVEFGVRLSSGTSLDCASCLKISSQATVPSMTSRSRISFRASESEPCCSTPAGWTVAKAARSASSSASKT